MSNTTSNGAPRAHSGAAPTYFVPSTVEQQDREALFRFPLVRSVLWTRKSIDSPIIVQPQDIIPPMLFTECNKQCILRELIANSTRQSSVNRIAQVLLKKDFSTSSYPYPFWCYILPDLSPTTSGDITIPISTEHLPRGSDNDM
jgi:hypothetical protein